MFATVSMWNPVRPVLWLQAADAITLVLIASSITAFLALNFTGATTFTSRSGVRREMFSYIPVMAWMTVVGVASRVVLSLV